MLKLILADNQAIFRAGIAKVLAVEDEMRIVAQAQTQEQMFMALDKFRAAVLVVAGGFHSDFNSILLAASKAKTRVVSPASLCSTGSPLPDQSRISWIEGYDLLHLESCWVPWEVVHTDYTLPTDHSGQHFLSGTNGLASGNHLA